jgi:alkaline phosphatase D
VDYVVHLGDYIYEYGEGEYGWGYSLGRIPLPDKEIISLYDYRKRLATYRTDLDLLQATSTSPGFLSGTIMRLPITFIGMAHHT